MRLTLIRSIPDYFKGARAKLRLLREIAQVSQKVAPLPTPGFFQAFRQAFKLHRDALYIPEEAYRLGMLNPARSGELFQDFISKNAMKKVQRSLNPGSWTCMIEDKSIFYKYCMALEVPIPRFYGCFFNGRAGWSHNGSALRNREDWVEFLCNGLPQAFVIKPAWGVYGSGVRIFSRQTPEMFTDADGQSFSPGDLYDTVFQNPKYNCLVIQERLKNHPELAQLSDTEYLQTVRLHTFVDGSNNCHIIFALLKIITGGNFVDNHKGGDTGNLYATIDKESGLITAASTWTKDGSGPTIVPRHPETGSLFEGFQIPRWEETCRLVTEAAFNFLPLRIIGWDVGITPDGPRIIEGNAWADPDDFEDAGRVLGSLRIE